MPAVESVNNIINATTALINAVVDSKGRSTSENALYIAKKLETYLEEIGQLAGFPTKNFKKIALGMYYNIADMVSGEAFETAVKNNAVNEFFGAYTRSKSQEYHIMYEALESGNTEKYEAAYNKAIKSGRQASDIYSGIKAQYKKAENVSIGGKDFNKLSSDDKKSVKSDAGSGMAAYKMTEDFGESETFDKLYKYYREGDKLEYKQMKKKLAESGKSETAIKDGITAARIKYLKKCGIEYTDFYIAKALTGKDYADSNHSGGVSRKEKEAAIDKMEIDDKTKKILKEII